MLTQAEADNLRQMSKLFVRATTISFRPGIDETYELLSSDGKEQFQLDLWRGTLRLSKLKYQNRARKHSVLVRVDIQGSPHTNPDGQQIGGTHIHLYREGFEDKWAEPVDSSVFSDLSNPQQVFADFCIFCNIQQPPPTQGGIA
jgi:hypothetical protein